MHWSVIYCIAKFAHRVHNEAQTAIVKQLGKKRQQKNRFRIRPGRTSDGWNGSNGSVGAGFCGIVCSPAHAQIVFHECFQIYMGKCGYATTI